MCLPALSMVDAVVISADLMAIGENFGRACFSRAATPATCGLDMEVPEMKSKFLPSWPRGLTAARTSTPGAITSGFRMSPPERRFGPRDEKAATAGASALDFTEAEKEALAPAPALVTYALMASPSVL